MLLHQHAIFLQTAITVHNPTALASDKMIMPAELRVQTLLLVMLQLTLQSRNLFLTHWQPLQRLTSHHHTHNLQRCLKRLTPRALLHLRLVTNQLLATQLLVSQLLSNKWAQVTSWWTCLLSLKFSGRRWTPCQTLAVSYL